MARRELFPIIYCGIRSSEIRSISRKKNLLLVTNSWHTFFFLFFVIKWEKNYITFIDKPGGSNSPNENEVFVFKLIFYLKFKIFQRSSKNICNMFLIDIKLVTRTSYFYFESQSKGII